VGDQENLHPRGAESCHQSRRCASMELGAGHAGPVSYT
jgi:hypothetical protein